MVDRSGVLREDSRRDGSESGDADPRECLVLALDLNNLVDAISLARSLVGHFRVAKIGLELYSAAGPKAIAAMADLGYDVWCDLKLHDIPTTVRRAARVIGERGAAFLTVHAAGGLSMLQSGVQGLAEGAAASGVADSGTAARVLAVTVLTSERDAPVGLLAERMRLASEAGCGGIVCAAGDLDAALRSSPGLVRVVPGIRMPGDPAHDQRRVATPAAARAAGADFLVIGRSVTRASDPVAAADRLHAHLRTSGL